MPDVEPDSPPSLDSPPDGAADGSGSSQGGPQAGSAAARGSAAHHAGAAALTVAALGVVFGDIGTSPLYALQTVFHADHGAVEPVRSDVFGVISLVFWSVTIVVSVKYVTLIMRADNNGEGGIMALIALVRQSIGSSRRATMVL